MTQSDTTRATVPIEPARTAGVDDAVWHNGPLALYLALHRDQRARLLLSAIVYVIKHSPSVLLPVITGLTVDKLASHAPLSELWPMAVGVLILIVQNFPGHWWHVRLLSQAVRAVEYRLRSSLSQRIQELSIGYYHNRSPSTLQAKMLRDVEAVEQMTRSLADGLLGSGSAIVVALVMTAWRAPQFLVLFLLTVPVAAGLILATRAHLARHNEVFREALDGMSSRVGEMTQMLPLTRAHGLEQEALARVEQSFARVSGTGLALDSINASFNGAAWVAFQGLNFACLGLAAWAYSTQAISISLGDVVLLSGFFSSLTGAVLGVAGTLPQINKGLAALRSIAELMRSPDREENAGKTCVNVVQGDIRFEAVDYRYRHAGRDALSGMNLHLRPGETVALVGPSGSGKSTMAHLVIGLLRPTRGRLLLDGQDAQGLDMRSWRQHVSVVPQDCQLLDASVRENVTYGLGPVREDVLLQALTDANCMDFVERLPHGLDTPVGNAGSQLSGGQRQRLAIARALVRTPRVLVLDEASSALDGESERHIQQALQRVRQGRTTLIVAHRLSTVQDADRIAVLDQGLLVDVGPHSELLQRCALYQRLVTSQLTPLQTHD